MDSPDKEPGDGPRSERQEPQDRIDRRANPRNALLMTGKVYQRGCLIDCVVSNVSVGGAKLLLPGPASDQLPDPADGAMVTLTLPRFGDLPARIVWTRETAIGIDFLQPSDEVAVLLAAYLNPGQTA